MHTIDGTNEVFGRLASRIAKILMGKTKASYLPYVMPTEKVTLENIDKIKFTGNKFENKKYYRYSGYPGGITERTLAQRWKRDSVEVFRKTVLDMLPKNKLRSKIIKNLIIK